MSNIGANNIRTRRLERFHNDDGTEENKAIDHRCSIDEEKMQKLQWALELLQLSKGYSEAQFDDINAAIDVLVTYIISDCNDAMYANDKSSLNYMKSFGKVFVVECVDVVKMKEDNAVKSYFSNAGQVAGLNPEVAPYRQRIHVLIDYKRGVYGAKDLHNNLHYQVYQKELKQFLQDVFFSQRTNIKLAGPDGNCGVMDDANVCIVPPPDPKSHDCIIYTSSTPFIVANGSNTEGDGVTPSFFSISGKGTDKLGTVIDELTTDHLYNRLKATGLETQRHVCGISRNQKSSLTHGFAASDCTDTTREDLLCLPSPQITRSNDKKEGLTKDEATLAISLQLCMVKMTTLLDLSTSLLGIPPIFDDKARNDRFSRQIHKDNRAEHYTAALSVNKLACHLDRQNGKGGTYGWNLTYFEYIRNKDIIDTNNQDYFERVNQGVYGRSICGALGKRVDNVSTLSEDIKDFISSLPTDRTKFDSSILHRRKDDTNVTYRKDDVARPIYLNKNVYYSYFVNVIFPWLTFRNKIGIQVSFPEIAEAVFVLLRFTSSPNAAAYVFEQVTDEAGVSIVIPDGCRLSTKLTELMQSEPANTLRKTQSHILAFHYGLPLVVQYIFKSMELLHGLAGGDHARYQPSTGMNVVQLDHEIGSLMNLNCLLSDLMTETDKEYITFKKDHGRIMTDAKLEVFARRILPITRLFIRKASAPYNQGGIKGFGDLIGTHFISVMSIGGWIQPGHLCNVGFSRGNDTANYLLAEYQVDVTKNQYIMSSIAMDPFFSKEGAMAKLIVENGACEMKRHIGRNVRWCDTVYVGPSAFLINFKDGRPVMLQKNGTETPIGTGFIVDGQRLSIGKPDLRVARGKSNSYLGGWWFVRPSIFSLSGAIIENRDVSCTDKTRAKRANAERRGKKKKGKPVKGAKTPKRRKVSNVSTSSFYNDPSQKWGLGKSKPQSVGNVCRRAATDLFRNIIQRQMLEKAGIRNVNPSIFSTQDRLMKLGSQNIKDLKKIYHYVEGMAVAYQQKEDVNEISSAARDEVKSCIESIRLQLNVGRDTFRRITRMATYESSNISSHSDTKEATSTSKDELTGEQANTTPSKNDHVGRQLDRNSSWFEIDESDDDAYNKNDPLTCTCVYSQGRLLPSYIGIKMLGNHNTIQISLRDEIANILGVGKAELNFSYSTTVWQGVTFVDCMIMKGLQLIKSSDSVFLKSPGARKRIPFTVGSYQINNSFYYETKVHAQLALWMVLLSGTGRSLVEELESRYLSARDMVILSPNEIYSNDLEGDITTKKSLPLCCIMRGGADIIAIDVDHMRFEHYFKTRHVETRSATSKNVKSCPSSFDREMFYRCNKTNTMKNLPNDITNLFKLKQTREGPIVTFLAISKFSTFVSVPSNAQELQYTKCGWAKATVQHNAHADRVDNYWFSPRKGYKFRSLAEVERFNGCVTICNDDEVAAYNMFKNKGGK